MRRPIAVIALAFSTVVSAPLPAQAAGNIEMTVYNAATSSPTISSTAYPICGTTTVEQISRDWREGAPTEAGCTQTDAFMVRYRAGLVVPGTGTSPVAVRFYNQSDDGFQLAINGSTVISNWTSQGVRTPYNASGVISLVPGTMYELEAWYFDNQVAASVALFWSLDGTQVLIPGTAFRPLPTAPPQTPTLTSSRSSASATVLKWTLASANENVTSYTLQKRTGAGSWVQLDSVAASSSAAVNGYLAYLDDAAKGLSFRVAAVNAAGAGGYSNVVYIGPPSAPIVTATRLSGSTAVVRWSIPASNGSTITRYNYGATSGSCSSSVAASTAENVSEVQVTGLTRGTRYTFCVQAQSDIGPGAMGSSAPLLMAEAPNAVADLAAASHTSSSITLRWTKPDTNGAELVSYSLQYGKNSFTSTISAPAGATSHTVNNLVVGERLQFRIAAVNEVGTGPWSATLEEAASAAPDAPLINVKSWTRTTVAIDWLLPEDNGAAITAMETQYSVSGGSWRNASAAPFNATRRLQSFSLSGMSANSTYTVRMRAINRDGPSEWGTSAPIVTTYSSSEWQQLAKDIAATKAKVEATKSGVVEVSDVADTAAAETFALNKQLLAIRNQIKVLNAKVAKICAARPKPKGC